MSIQDIKAQPGTAIPAGNPTTLGSRGRKILNLIPKYLSYLLTFSNFKILKTILKDLGL